MGNVYDARLDSTAGSVHDEDKNEYKCWECANTFPVDEIVNGRKWWGADCNHDFVPLCEPCYEELERIDAELEAEEEKQLDAAIYNDEIKKLHK